jgi:plastocyanin
MRHLTGITQHLQPRGWITSLAAIVTACAFHPVWAGALKLTVTDSEGKPAPDVVVLIAPGDKGATLAAPAPTPPLVIAQENLRFTPFLTVAAMGSTVRFENRDGYDHHVRSTASGPLGQIPAVTSFELRLKASSSPKRTRSGDYGTPNTEPNTSKEPNPAESVKSADIKLDQPGAIGLGCHLHSSMRGQLYVANTPWFGKTDANGQLTLNGLPDGSAQVTLWHPDQFQNQATLQVQLSNSPTLAASKLNFIPKRRRS